MPYTIAIWLILIAGFVYLQAGHGPLGGRYDPTPIIDIIAYSIALSTRFRTMLPLPRPPLYILMSATVVTSIPSPMAWNHRGGQIGL